MVDVVDRVKLDFPFLPDISGQTSLTGWDIVRGRLRINAVAMVMSAVSRKK